MTGADAIVEMVVGSTASATHTVTGTDIDAFARLTGDSNPIHLDDDYAAATRFGRRIAHGILAAGYVSAILGTRLPGPGSIYLSQMLKFTAPVYLGDSITAIVTIENIREDKPIVTAQTECVNQDGKVVLSGEATLLCEEPADRPSPS